MTYGPARKVPQDTNATGLVIYDILSGVELKFLFLMVERFSVIFGHLLTRVRPEDRNSENKSEDYPKEWLVFFRALTASTFMRRQPNYQRLSLSFLIQLTLILKHNDPRCIGLALERIRWTFAVNESGDSHTCIPVDLLQESSMVQQIKGVGRRDPTAYWLLESRAKLQSYIRLHEVEARQNSELGPLSSNKKSRSMEQRRISRSIAIVWLNIISDIKAIEQNTDLDVIQGLDNEQAITRFADRSSVLYRAEDAAEHILVAGSAFIKGFATGCKVAIPPRPYAILSCLHRVSRKKKSNVQSDLAKTAKQRKLEAEQSLTKDGHVIVSSSFSILDGITKAGDGKSSIYPAVLSSMSDNLPYTEEEGQIGSGPNKPVILARDKDATVQYLKHQSNRGESNQDAPIHRLVDMTKDLRGNIPKRQGGHANTVETLARDLICEMVNKYHFHGIEMLCLTMDVSELMTCLRAIPHEKRGKLNGETTPHGRLSKVKKASDDLTSHGNRTDLLTCGDPRFIRLLFNTICNQAKSLENGDWKLHRQVQPFALAIIGGSADACVVVGVEGKQFIRLNSASITLSIADVEDELDSGSEVVNAEEGEMMVYATMQAIFKMGFTHDSGEDIDCIVAIHSDDSDAFGGLSMPTIFNIESTCIKKNKGFRGHIRTYIPSRSKEVCHSNHQTG